MQRISQGKANHWIPIMRWIIIMGLSLLLILGIFRGPAESMSLWRAHGRPTATWVKLLIMFWLNVIFSCVHYKQHVVPSLKWKFLLARQGVIDCTSLLRLHGVNRPRLIQWKHNLIITVHQFYTLTQSSRLFTCWNRIRPSQGHPL